MDPALQVELIEMQHVLFAWFLLFPFFMYQCYEIYIRLQRLYRAVRFKYFGGYEMWIGQLRRSIQFAEGGPGLIARYRAERSFIGIHLYRDEEGEQDA